MSGSAVLQTGTITPGHLVSWTTTGVVQDAGTPENPALTSGFGIVSNNNQIVTLANAPVTGAYSSLSFGITSTAANITLASYGGAPNLPLNFVLNGTTYPVPGTGGPYLPLSGGTMTGNIGVPTTQAWSTAATSQAAISGLWTATGTALNSGGPLGLALFLNVDTTVNASANSGGMAVAVFNGDYYTGAQGGLTGVTANMAIAPGQTLSETLSREFVGGRDFASSFSPAGAWPHAIIGRTIAVELSGAATGYGSLVGLEIATHALSGATVQNYSNLYLMRYSDDAVQGSVSDRMLGFWNQYAQGATAGSPVIIDVGPGGQQNLFYPGSTVGTIFKVSKGLTDGNLTVGTCFDLSAITTVSGYLFNATNFSVAGNGATVARGSISAQPVGGNALNITGGASGSNVTSVSATGADTNINMDFFIKGTAQFNFLNAAAATAFQILPVASAVSYLSVSPAASGNVIMDTGGTATGIALGSVSATGVSISRSSGAVGFYGTAPATIQTVTGSKGGNAALASLMTALANLGLVTNSTT